jgi:hypothetical protein
MAHVAIGMCPDCGNTLKAREHAPRKQMHITCRCGWRGDLQVDDALVQRAGLMRASGAGHRRPKSIWRRFVARLRSWWPQLSLKH